MIKHPILHTATRCALPAGVVVLGLLTSSCKIPSRATWAMVQQKGLIPVMMSQTENPEPAPPNASQLASKEAAPVRLMEAPPLKVQAVQQPEIARVPLASPVPGHPGYVYSPHVAGRKLVDVRNYAAGAEVRCPYTMQAFNVPDFTASAMAEATPRPRPQRSIAEVVSSSNAIPGSGEVPLLSPIPNPAPVTTSPLEGDIPYGSRVPGRAGFVYSPFANKNQLVDVAGIAPGVEVKCPYTNQLFRVPEPLPEEMAPAPATVIPPAPDQVPPVAPAAPEVPSPNPGTPPVVTELPMASWADKEKNLVQSPFGSAGQLIDVSGRTPGSTMQCPFTNKEFVIPAP